MIENEKISGLFPFLIADPERGVLALKVKGGLIRKDGGAWLQHD